MKSKVLATYMLASVAFMASAEKPADAQQPAKPKAQVQYEKALAELDTLRQRREALSKAIRNVDDSLNNFRDLPLHAKITEYADEIRQLNEDNDHIQAQLALRTEWMKGFLPDYIKEKEPLLQKDITKVTMAEITGLQKDFEPFISDPSGGAMLSRINNRINILKNVEALRSQVASPYNAAMVAAIPSRIDALGSRLKPEEVVALHAELDKPASLFPKGLEVFRKVVTSFREDSYVKRKRDPEHKKKMTAIDAKNDSGQVIAVFNEVVKANDADIKAYVLPVPYLRTKWEEYCKEVRRDPLRTDPLAIENEILN